MERKSDGLATIRFHVLREAIFSKTERTERFDRLERTEGQ